METVWIVLSQLVLLHTVTGSKMNVALNKPASASSMTPGYSAKTAVDGNTVANGWEPNKIINTKNKEPFAWWKVDLGLDVQDATVRIYFRTPFAVRRNGVQLYTSKRDFSSYPGGQLCDTVTGSDIPAVYNATCSGRWRYLLLYTNTSNNDEGPVLDFGEVEVYGQISCSDGTYGEDCTKTCSSRNCVTMTTCERDGKCSDGCQSGWSGEDCKECDSDHYGPSCALRCTDRQCLDGSPACDHVTGQCVRGCRAGYKELDCVKACDTSYYGPGCKYLCTGRNCLSSPSKCDHVTGECVNGCKSGFKGKSCIEDCDSDTYGYKCSLSCSGRKCLHSSSYCDHVTGQCVGGCQAGYNGTDCRQECDSDTYGHGCNLTCSDRKCLNSSSHCDHATGQCVGGCQSGYNGTDCKEACSANVTYGVNCAKSCSSRHCSPSTPRTCDPQTGQCPGVCQSGWTGVDCTQTKQNIKGINSINEYITVTIRPRHTRHCQGESGCPADGTCSHGCQDGWTGNTCIQECPRGFYGNGCNTTCGNCSSGVVCDHVTGNCSRGCKAGWRSNKCDQVCNDGKYGPNCTEKCGKCDGVCDSVNGRCPAGCLEGYNGTKCDLALEAASTGEPTDIIVPAAAGAAAALVVIVVIIVVVVLLRRRRNSPGSKPDQDFHRPSSNLDRGNNVYENVTMDAIPKRIEGRAPERNSVKPPLPSRADDNDQSEEVLDEEEAPTSTPYYNIDEDDVIREVAVENLAATVQRIQSREGRFEAEYSRLPTGFTATYADSQKKENTGKNKFIGYYPYDYNRVRLSLLPDVPGSDYINASIMHNINETKTYIAAQAPKKITLGDFWRMIWEQRVGFVVMLTGLVEDAKVKCYQYWPEKDLLTTDHFRVAMEDTNIRANYTVRTMKVVKIETGETREVVQYHYTTWPDHGVPDTLALVNFIWMMRRAHTRTDGPLLVHCSAGIGRTGTYIAVDSLLDQAREEGKVDVQGYVSMMRGQRKNMIQTTFQYACVFNCLVEMTKYGNTSLTVDDFTTLYTNSGMDARVDSNDKSFRELTQLMLCEQNAGAQVKNRMWVDGNQNFTVRSAPSLRSVRGHLLCESPHPGQEKLLWKLVEENNVNNVIVLDKPQVDLVEKKGGSKTFGNIRLLTTDQTKLTSDISLSKQLIQIPGKESKRKLQLIQFLETVSVESLSTSFLEQNQLKLMSTELSSRVVLHSSTDRKVGVLFCVLGNLMSEIQEDETVDVLHQVRSFTRIFPDIRLNQDDVKQLFNFARRCAQLTASTYANM